MNVADEQSKLAAGSLTPLADPTLNAKFSVEQRRALAHLCQIHERGLNPRQLNRRSLLLAVYILLTLGFAVLLLNMTAFAAPGYFFLGYIVGALLQNLRILMVFRRIWPVYERIIDWPRAFNLLKAAGKLEGSRGTKRIA